jgi:hypothetical protein
MTLKKKGVHALSTAARVHLLRLNCFLQPQPGGPILDSRHVKGGPFAQWRGPEYAGAVPIFSGHEVCLVDNV